MSEVIMDCALRLRCLDGYISPQKIVVGKGDSTRSIDTYYILVKLVDLNDDACLVPFVGIRTCLVFEYMLCGQLQKVVISWCALSTSQLL